MDRLGYYLNICIFSTAKGLFLLTLFLKIFSEQLNWQPVSKVGPISFENIKYRPNPSNVEIFNEKLKWSKESKLAKVSNENLRFTPPHSRISV